MNNHMLFDLGTRDSNYNVKNGAIPRSTNTKTFVKTATSSRNGYAYSYNLITYSVKTQSMLFMTILNHSQLGI